MQFYCPRCWLVVVLIYSVNKGSAQFCGQTEFSVGPGMTGLLNSPGYPSSYPRNTQCTYHIRSTEPSNHISLTFEVFNLELHARCDFDSLSLYDGAGTNAPLLGKFCGSRTPPTFSSRGQEITIVFTADDSTAGDGFSIRYLAGCTYNFEATSGRITSPNYPLNYPDESDCVYNIEPTSGSQMLLDFQDFYLEDSLQCKFDRLELSLGQGEPFAKVCGQRNPFKKLVNSSRLTMRFVTDRSVGRTGFQIQYSMSTDCSVNNGGCSHYCRVIKPGKVLCYCDTGYAVDENGVKCTDINECKQSLCSDECENTDGSFTCSCSKPGYALAPDGRTCTDMACWVNNGGCEHICQSDHEGKSQCACYKGFTLKNDKKSCQDINECTTEDPGFRHRCEQTCFNEAGSYYCDCNKGYRLDDNGRTCSDIDECPYHYDDCDHDCVNVPGGWECSCYQGYEVNPLKPDECDNIDECERGLAPSTCSACVDKIGTFVCVCGNGFESSDQDTNCTDIDECARSNGGCHQLCFNSPGSYRCECMSGYVRTKSNSDHCEDINECAPNSGRGPCDHFCENLPGSFECACVGGFQLAHDRLQCQDINECEKDNGSCKQKCVNTDGSYHCECFPGYKDVNATCTDINECVSSPCNVDVGALCSNTEGSFICECPPGYLVENVTLCTDIDECSQSDHGCSQLCNNTMGSYYCSCRPGYESSGLKDCVDINECDLGVCDHMCVNEVGSFHCLCRDGYYLTGNGLNCTDHDECATAVHGCEQICVNEIGSYRCQCRHGFIINGDNSTCSDIEECVGGLDGCSNDCVNTIGSFFCTCPNGFVLGSDNKTCEDLNECTRNNGGCEHICTNSNGSYSCGCNPGYIFDGRRNCTDINECARDNGGCNQTCINTDGSYECSCRPTFKLLADNQTCDYCPSCNDFQQITFDVKDTNRMVTLAHQLRESNFRLSAELSQLMERIAWLETHVNPITGEAVPPDASP